MKRILSTLIVCVASAAAMMLAACGTPGAAPTASQVAEIQTACAIDAGIRPTVTALLAIPDLAKPAEISAVTVARLAIDPVCANPSAPLQASAMAAFTGAAGQVVGIVAQLQARRSSAH